MITDSIGLHSVLIGLLLEMGSKKTSTLGKARNGFQGIQKSKKLKLASNNFDTVHRGHCTFVQDISLF